MNRQSTMIKVHISGELLTIKTVSAKGSSPHWFALLRSELQRLEAAKGQSILVSDLFSFARLQLEQVSESQRYLSIRFTWLTENGSNHVAGRVEIIRLPYQMFHEFATGNRNMDGQSWKFLFAPQNCRPKIEFNSSRNLRAVINEPQLRHKLGLALYRNFQWFGCQKVVLTDDFIPYSFYFRSYGVCGMDLCGGLILHNQQDLRHAQYSLHT